MKNLLKEKMSKAAATPSDTCEITLRKATLLITNFPNL
jgi:hypothetical protein